MTAFIQNNARSALTADIDVTFLFICNFEKRRIFIRVVFLILELVKSMY